MNGPFKGTQLPPQARYYATMIVPALLGFFEQEVHPALFRWADRDYDAIINIGCSEGLYLVGLGRTHRRAKLIGYEAQSNFHDTARLVAEANGVDDRLELRGFCRPADLIADLRQHPCALVVIDIEGGEVDFTDRDTVAALARADLVVECHDGIRADASARVTAALAETHRVELLPEGPRNPNAVRWLRRRRQVERWLAVWEGRDSFCQWAIADSRGDA